MRAYTYVLLIGTACAAVVILIPSVMRLSTQQYMYISLDDVPKTEVALVLGASVRNGKPSPILEERAHQAIQLYLKGKVKKIMVTGDNGALSHDEVTPVRKYLLNAGIPPEDIFLDHAGFDTYSSMYRARDVFKAESMTIVTQHFHLPRALYIARSLGIPAYGIVANGSGSFKEDYLREIPASLKALLDLFTGRHPKYLGPAIPLTGDGRPTWY